jgi:hypothetical protein
VVDQVERPGSDVFEPEPGYERLWWTRDQMHFPRPLYP